MSSGEKRVLKLGYKASAEQFDPRTLLDFGVAAEKVGFDSVFVSDHFQPWRHTDGHAPYSMAWLGALGAKTECIQMGTSVMTPTFRYHPSIVAHAFGTLGCLFPGRINMTHPRIELGQLVMLNLPRPVAGQPHIQILPDMPEGLLRPLLLLLQPLGARTGNLPHQSSVEFIATSGDNR